MKITFSCKATHPFVAVNTLVIKTTRGLKLVVDREETDYTVVSNNEDNSYIIMTWENCYVHSINENTIFGDGAMIVDTKEFQNLVRDYQSRYFEFDEDLALEKVEDGSYDISILDYHFSD